jgi:hypothetical protein
MINPAGAEMTRRLLSDRHVASISLPDARSQVLLARLDSIRRAATAAVLAAQTASDISASLALVDHLDDTTATAEVIRRAGNQPGDLILLPSGTATGKHLSTALGALFKLRKQFGDVPLKNMHVVLHGLKQPTKWSSDMVSQADGMVQRLKNDTLVTIRGVGRARMTRIPMTATTATAAVGVVHP